MCRANFCRRERGRGVCCYCTLSCRHHLLRSWTTRRRNVVAVVVVDVVAVVVKTADPNVLESVCELAYHSVHLGLNLKRHKKGFLMFMSAVRAVK